MPEDNIVVLAFSFLLVVISLKNGVVLPDDSGDLKQGIIAETEQKSVPIKEHYNKCAKLLREYSDIAETYNEISQGDYISRLIEQQQKRDNPQVRLKR